MDFRAAHPVTPPHMSLFGSEASAVAAAAAAASGLPGLSPLSLLHHHSAAAAAPFAGALYPGGKLKNQAIALDERCSEPVEFTRFGCIGVLIFVQAAGSTAHKYRQHFICRPSKL